MEVSEMIVRAHLMRALSGRGVIWRLSMYAFHFGMTHLREEIVNIPIDATIFKEATIHLFNSDLD